MSAEKNFYRRPEGYIPYWEAEVERLNRISQGDSEYISVMECFAGFTMDDLDPCCTFAETTVLFSLDGADYEIDLTHQHAAELRAIFADYIKVARVVASDVADPPVQPEA